MWQYALKISLSAVILVAVAELAKRSSLAAAALASIPVTSLLALVWLYLDSNDIQQVAALSSNIFWLVLPSLALFIVLPWLLKSGIGFWISLLASCALTIVLYLCMIKLLAVFGTRP